MISFITGILASIGGLVVILAAYIWLFKPIKYVRTEEIIYPDELVDLEVSHYNLGNALIGLNNLKMAAKQDEDVNPEIIEEIERIFKIVESVQKSFANDED